MLARRVRRVADARSRPRPAPIDAVVSATTAAPPRRRARRRRALEEQLALQRVLPAATRHAPARRRPRQPPELHREVAAHARQQVVALERRLRRSASTQLEAGAPDRTPSTIATARLQLDDRRRHDLGQRVVERGDPRASRSAAARARARGRRRSRPAARTGRARRRAISARARAPRGRGGSAGDPSARDSDRAAGSARPTVRRARAARDAWISISATRPWTSGSCGASSARMRPRRSASSHSAGRIQSSPGGRRVALVEDQVDDLEHRRQARRQLGAARHLERHAPSASVRFARTMRCAIVGSGHEEGARDLRRSSGRRAVAA